MVYSREDALEQILRKCVDQLARNMSACPLSCWCRLYMYTPLTVSPLSFRNKEEGESRAEGERRKLC